MPGILGIIVSSVTIACLFLLPRDYNSRFVIVGGHAAVAAAHCLVGNYSITVMWVILTIAWLVMANLLKYRPYQHRELNYERDTIFG